MDNILLNGIKKYFKTLEYVGNINPKETIKLYILTFLKEYIDNLTEMDNRIYDVFNCLYRGSCTINKRLGCITISDNDGFTYTFNFNLS